MKQENLAEMEIWANSRGYTWNCMYARDSLAKHLRKKFVNVVMYWQITRQKSVQTIRWLLQWPRNLEMQSKFHQVGNNYVLFVTKLKKVMLTDSVKAALKLEKLPVPLTVMKKLHKDNLQNVILNANWILVKCLHLLLTLYQRSKGNFMQRNRYRKWFKHWRILVTLLFMKNCVTIQFLWKITIVSQSRPDWTFNILSWIHRKMIQVICLTLWRLGGFGDFRKKKTAVFSWLTNPLAPPPIALESCSTAQTDRPV